MSESLRNELRSAIFKSSEVHCALHYFLRELVYSEWKNWQSFFSVLLENQEELNNFLRPLRTEKTRKMVFRHLREFKNYREHDFLTASLSFSQEATLVWCYFYQRNESGRLLALACLELSILSSTAQVHQMQSPGWLMEKIFLKVSDFHHYKLKAHPALKHPSGPFVFQSVSLSKKAKSN